MIALAGRLGAVGLATGHYARIRDDGDGPLLAGPATARRTRPTCSPRSPRVTGSPALPTRRADEARGAGDRGRAGLEVAGRAESQDLCFLAGQGKREFLRRHAGLEERPGEIVDRAGRRSGDHSGHHDFTVGQRRGLGVGVGSRSTCWPPTPPPTTSSPAAVRAVLQPHADPRARGFIAGPSGSTASASATTRPGGRASGWSPGGGRARPSSRWPSPWTASAPGQVACLLDGDLVVGHGTIV